MKTRLLLIILTIIFECYSVQGQCDYITPPSVKKIDFARRQITFSDVTINGRRTTFMKVNKGEYITIKTKVKSEKNGNYCPNCIVQVYWGIKGHASTCAKSFGRYRFSSKESSQKFRAPNKDGIYYITMGGSLEYSCKNNVNRPECSPDYAIAVLKVGNPKPDKKIALEKVERNNRDFLKTRLLSSGCFVNMNKIQWYFGGKKIGIHDNKKEIPLTTRGVYTATWSNCLDSVSKSFPYRGRRINRSPQNETQNNSQSNNDVSELIKTKDKFILKNLIFDQGKSYIKRMAAIDLDKLAKVMLANRSLSILIEGHTDYRGGAKANLILSEKRVKSVKKYLVKMGVSEKNIKTKGLGAQKPLIVNSDIKKCKINRRVEVTVLSR